MSGGGTDFFGAVIVKTPSDDRVEVISFGLISPKKNKSKFIHKIIKN